MKKRTALVVLLLAAAGALGAQDVQDILKNIEALNRFSDTYSATLRIASYAPDAPVAVASYRMYTKGLRKVLLVFREPARDAGKKIAMNGDSMWFYFPRARQSILVRPVSTLTGSVSVGDMIGPPALELYDFTASEPKEDGILLTFSAKGPSSPYGRVAYLYRDGRIVSQSSYTRSGTLLKTTTYMEYAADAGGGFPTKIRIQNAVYPGYYSLIELSQLKPADTLPDFYFTPEGLADAGSKTP